MRPLRYFVMAVSVLGLAGLAACKSAHLSGGKLHFDQKRYERAKEQFLLAKEEQPENGEVRLWLGRAYAELGEVEKADEAFTAAKETDPELSEQVANARQHYWTDKHNEGLKFASQGNSARQAGNEEEAREAFEEALVEFRKATVYDPDRLETFTFIGKLQFQLGRTDEAIATFREVKELAAEQIAGAADPKAAQEIEQEVDDLLAAVYWDLGDRAYQEGEWDDAIKFYKEVRAITPEDPDLLYQLAGGYFQKAIDAETPAEERTEYMRNAANLYGQVVERVKGDEDALYNMTVALWELGEYEQGAQRAQTLVDLNPKDGEYHILLGRMLNKLGKQEEFVKEFILGKALRDGRMDPPGTDVRSEVQSYGPDTDIKDMLRMMGQPQEVRRFDYQGDQEYVVWFYWSEGKAYAFVDGAQQFEVVFEPVTQGT
ncbi:MAG: tetratricopeptide repeat protein [Candidatus Eisenbacteria bacterium]|nr:tetratricopeptide repeat protein [Candidatus Eisenbacteria bacterium]